MTVHQKVITNGHVAWFSDDYPSLDQGITECKAQWPDAVVTTDELEPNDWSGTQREVCIVVKIGEPELFRVEVIADDSGNWVSNAMRYVTREAADEAAKDLAARWCLVRNYRIMPDAGEDVGAVVQIKRLGLHHGSAVCIGKGDGETKCRWRHVSRPAWFDGQPVIEDASLQEVMRRVIDDGERLYR